MTLSGFPMEKLIYFIYFYVNISRIGCCSCCRSCLHVKLLLHTMVTKDQRGRSCSCSASSSVSASFAFYFPQLDCLDATGRSSAAAGRCCSSIRRKHLQHLDQETCFPSRKTLSAARVCVSGFSCCCWTWSWPWWDVWSRTLHYPRDYFPHKAGKEREERERRPCCLRRSSLQRGPAPAAAAG